MLPRLPWLDSLAGLILTRPCGLCDRPCAEGLCDRCARQLLAAAAPRWQPPLLSWGPYGGDLRRAIARLKYQGRRDLAPWLGRQLAMLIRDHGPAPDDTSAWLVPVPIHADRRRQRGFNQAELLARMVGRQLGLRVAPQLLQRQRRTLPQHGLGVDERQRNLQGAFLAAAPIPGVGLWLVDDICTTGATLRAAQQSLRARGWCVTGWLVLARAERNSS
jgi:ComF family protein